MQQIDCELKPSQYRNIFWLGMVMAIACIILLLPLPLMYKIALWILTLASVWLAQISTYHILVMSTLTRAATAYTSSAEFDFLDWHLQVARGTFSVPWGNRQEVWQAKLERIFDMGNVVVMDFEVFEPMQAKIRSQIWRDQVDSDTWRLIKILAR